MLQGRMEYRFGDHTYLIEPGDAFTFSGNVVHGPEKLLDERIKFMAIIFYGEWSLLLGQIGRGEYPPGRSRWLRG